MKLFKLLILKAFAIAYITTIAIVVAYGIAEVIFPELNFWVVLAVCWLLSLNLIFEDEREVFFKKVLQFPISTYLPRKSRRKHQDP